MYYLGTLFALHIKPGDLELVKIPMRVAIEKAEGKKEKGNVWKNGSCQTVLLASLFRSVHNKKRKGSIIQMHPKTL